MIVGVDVDCIREIGNCKICIPCLECFIPLILKRFSLNFIFLLLWPCSVLSVLFFVITYRHNVNFLGNTKVKKIRVSKMTV